MIYYVKNKSRALCLRKAKKRELPETAECVKEVYSGCYITPDIPGMLNEAAAVYAAFDEKGKVAATLAFSHEKFTEAFDMCMHTVRKEYRGNNLGTALTDYALKRFKKKPRRIICSHPVTTHAAAQHQLEKCGLVPTGFLFGVYNTKKILTIDESSQKQTLGIYILPSEKRKRQILYLPEDIISTAGKIYGSAEIPYVIKVKEGNNAAKEKSVLYFYNDDYHNTLYIQIYACGKNLYRAVREIVQKYSHNSLQTVIVYLNINDTDAVFGYKTLIADNYIFSGFSLSEKENGYAVFYNPLNIKIRFGNLKTTEKPCEILKELRIKK